MKGTGLEEDTREEAGWGPCGGELEPGPGGLSGSEEVRLLSDFGVQLMGFAKAVGGARGDEASEEVA